MVVREDRVGLRKRVLSWRIVIGCDDLYLQILLSSIYPCTLTIRVASTSCNICYIDMATLSGRIESDSDPTHI